MFTIVDESRDVTSVDDGKLLFHDDGAIDRYEAARQVIHDAHEYEVARMQKKAARAMAASAYLAALKRGAAQ